MAIGFVVRGLGEGEGNGCEMWWTGVGVTILGCVYGGGGGQRSVGR